VVRQEPDALRSYVHIGTGNYNRGTAKLYTDMGLLTSRNEITEDVVELFHYLTGRSLKTNYKKLLVAPVNMKERFLAMIERETANKKDGKPAHVIGKMNSFEDQAIGRALYKASQGGVDVDLFVRGFCVLKPKVPQLSERIRVISIIGRFLEHSRLYYFRNGAKDPLDGEFYLGSADWMYRNLNSRVEAIVPVLDRALREKCWDVIQIMLNDQRQAWDMQADGTYIQRIPTTEAQQIGTHQALMKLTRKVLVPGSVPYVDETEVSSYEVTQQDETPRRSPRKSRRKR
jgi:polyphosphate kinase